MSVRTCLFAAALMLSAAPIWADEFPPPPIHAGAPISVQGYGRQNPACLAWTNGCVLCVADGQGASRCTPPGIACQPAGITCKTKKPAEPEAQ